MRKLSIEQKNELTKNIIEIMKQGTSDDYVSEILAYENEKSDTIL